MNILEVKSLYKTYPNGCQALKDVSFEVAQGEFLVVIGLSGSGKSTLLRCINRIHPASSGQIIIEGQEVTGLKGKELRKLRSQIGMIFQHFNLVPRKSAMVNVLTGVLARVGIMRSVLGLFSKEDQTEAIEKIKIVNLAGKEDVRADNLSGGQQQRVSIARALMQRPKLLLADEPVASLDPATSNSVMQYLEKINKEMGVTVICNLHFLSLVRRYATRVIALKGGEIVFRGTPEQITEEWFKTIYGEDAVEVSVH